MEIIQSTNVLKNIKGDDYALLPSRTSLKVVLDVITSCMKLGKEQAWVYNQKIFLPKDMSLAVIAQWVSSSPYANNTRAVASPSGMQEESMQLMNEIYQIDLISASTEARDRKEEVGIAIKSFQGGKILKKNNMTIFQVTHELIDNSYQDGAKILNREVIRIEGLRGYIRMQDIPYYDDFSTREVIG